MCENTNVPKKVIEFDNVREIKIIRPFGNGSLAIPRKFIDDVAGQDVEYKAVLTDEGIWVEPYVPEKLDASTKEGLRDVLEHCIDTTDTLEAAVDAFIRKVSISNKEVVVEDCEDIPMPIPNNLSELSDAYMQH